MSERGASGSGIYSALPLRDLGRAEPVPFGFRMPRALLAVPGAGMGLEPTWPANGYGDPLPPITIDHVLFDRRLDLVRYEVAALAGTDHRPVFAVLVLP